MVEDGRVMLPVVAASEVGSTSEIRLVAFPDSPWTSSNQIVSFHMPQTSHEMFIFSDVTVTTCIVVGVSHPIRLCIFLYLRLVFKSKLANVMSWPKDSLV